MKKFLTVFLLCLMSAVCAFAFAACGSDNDKKTDGDGEQEQEPSTAVKTTVTEDEWKTALSYFMVNWDEENDEPLQSDYPRINFSCTVDWGSDTIPNSVYGVDYDNEIGYFEGWEEYDLRVYPVYSWKEDGVCYYAGENAVCGGEDSYLFWYKNEIEEDELPIYFADSISAAGGHYISWQKLADKYAQFTYSEENEEYTSTFGYTDYYEERVNGHYEIIEVECTANITLKFQDGKLVHMVYTNSVNDGNYGEDIIDDLNVTVSFTYTYATTLTVPEHFLNMEAGDEIILS